MNANRARAVRLILVVVAIFVAQLAATRPLSAQTTDGVSFPGNYGQAIGAPSWEPADPAVAASDSDGDGTWSLTVTLPRGDYEFKVAVGGGWGENYGRGGAPNGDNIPLRVAAESEVTFSFRPADGWIGVRVGDDDVVVAGEPVDAAGVPSATVGDGLVDAAALLHDSRSDLYRTPPGAHPVGAPVTLRLRTARDDVESARLLVDNLTLQQSSSLPMARVAADEEYDWWQTTLPPVEDVSVLNYKFEVRDGPATLFYADSGALVGGSYDGGAGAPAEARPGSTLGWDLYFYAPDFEAPAWAADAIIYQIFPDRFRNGDPANDPQADDWGYPGERGISFPIAPWNTIVPDPDPNDPTVNPWYATWNATFYGGDLQGVREKLDYLQALGVNTIYFTPIHEAVTNHRYDARDYRLVEDALAVRGDAEASMALFRDFAAEVHARGMHLILDAVPNHTSSDSPQFDRYSRWESVGACESAESDFRDRYLFEAADPAGSGSCAGDANYRGFFNIDILPQANSAGEAVIEEWNGPDGITGAWLQIPGVDGWRVDTVYDVIQVNPYFFEPFRDAARAANPDALLVAETWPEDAVRERVLGDEFDTTMNYRFAWAVLGFLRDTPFTDTNDPVIEPLSASQFDAALRALQEDYPPAAFASAMNLIDSHDTQRAVFVLDHEPVDRATLTPANNFADGRRRLALAAVLQFTLPGAPTVYYGDEVGLAGFGIDPTRDDPHNRQPYPWVDAAGYESLPAWRKQDPALLDHYRQLGQLRAAHSYLRTGSWVTLAADDAGVYAYLRGDESGAGVVIVNRSEITQSVPLTVAGLLPFDTILHSTLATDTLTVDAAGFFTVTVPAMDFRILITEEGIDLAAPEAPQLEALAGSGAVTLTVTGAQEGERVRFYRSLLDGGYALLAETAGADRVTLLDAALTNGADYFYKAARVAANGLLGAPSETVAALPSVAVTRAQLGGSLVLTHTVSAITPTAEITGLVTAPGLTEAIGTREGLRAELGYLAQNAADYVWVQGEYAGDAGDADLYAARLLPEAAGNAVYRWRFSTDRGRTWTQSDAGRLAVLPAADQEAPKPPFRLDALSEDPAQVVIAWRLSRPRDLAGFRVCRADVSAGEEGCAVELSFGKAQNVYTDTTVSTGHTYSYTVRVFDTSFNFSEPSTPITLTAESKVTDVTFRVQVPPETPADATIYIAGDRPELFGAAWDPGRTPMTPVGDGVWEFSASIQDGATVQYKYTRGSWETVEEWGSLVGLANRKVIVRRQPDGTMLVDNTSTAWESDAPDDTLAVQKWSD